MMLSYRDNTDTGLNSPHAHSVRAGLYGLFISFLLLAYSSSAARLYLRIKAKNYGGEDWCILAALVICPISPLTAQF